jgi:hypothetical protein
MTTITIDRAVLEQALDLGVDAQHIAGMQAKIDLLEQENDWIADVSVRHAVNHRLVEIRLLLRDGHTKNINGGAHDHHHD